MSNTTQQPLNTIANIDVLLEVFSQDKLSSITSFINWRAQWSEPKKKYLKRPLQNISTPTAHLSLDKAAHLSKSIGLVCSDAHQIIALDIDGVPIDLHPSPLSLLLQAHPTYAEHSPSNKPNHARLLYSLPSTLDKEKLKRKTTVNIDENHLELYSASTNFVTLTGNKTSYSTDTITEITPAQLASYFPEFLIDPTQPAGKLIPHPSSQPIPTRDLSVRLTNLTPHATWIQEVPIERNNSALLTFMGKHSLVYHDYWLLGIMAIHAAFGEMTGFQIADDWSKLSGDDYDEDELRSRWATISEPTYEPPRENLPARQRTITAATYQWMFNEFTIHWPVTRGKTLQPKHDEYENFLAFLEYKGLTVEEDRLTNTVFLDGPDYTLYPAYYTTKEAAYKIETEDMERLSAVLVNQMMPYNFRPTTNMVYTWLRDIILSKNTPINRFAREIANLPSYDPTTEPDYLHIISTDIIQRDPKFEAPTEEFHNILVRKWLLSLGRNLWIEETKLAGRTPATTEGVLILSSAEGGINKSSLGIRLFPPEWHHLHICTKPRLSNQYMDKDSVHLTIGRIIVDFDEAERIFKTNDVADLKAYLTTKTDTFRPPYRRNPISYKRFFACMASTNMTDLVLPREGARRYWWLNVKYVDTYKLDEMNRYDIWRQIYYELKQSKGKRDPYLLTNNEVKYLERYLCAHTTHNSLEELLLDVYDFSPSGFAKYTGKRLTGVNNHSYSLTEIQNRLLVLTNGQSFKPKALANTLTTLLKIYAPDFVVSRQAIVGGITEVRRQKRYFMPEERNDALKRAAEQDLD